MGKRRRGGRRRKRRTQQVGQPLPQVSKSMVVSRGKVGDGVSTLIQNVRRVLLPYTAKKLKERKKARLKDYLSVASPLGVTHLLFFSQSSHFHTTLRVGCVPRGPTLQFKVEKYTLMSQVRAKRPVNLNTMFNVSPLVVLDAFDMSKPEEKLITVTFQNLFPAINVATVKLADCKRVLLMRKDKESGCIEFRHYAILVKPAGLSRSVRSIVKARIPNLSKLGDISEFVTGLAGLDPDSEFEDESAQVEMPDDFGGHNYKSLVKLQEIGPRMSLRLIKVEQGFCAGEVLYHAFISKEAKEVEALRQSANAKAALKQKRKAHQETNVQRKQLERDEKLRIRAERRAQKAAAADAKLGDDVATDDEGEADDEGEGEGEGDGKGEGAVKGSTDQPLAAATPVGDAKGSAATRAAEVMQQQRTKKKEKRRKSSTVNLSGGIRLKRKRRE